MQEAEAKRCDEAGEYLRAIHGYDACWAQRRLSKEGMLDALVLAWQMTDPGLSSGARLTDAEVEFASQRFLSWGRAWRPLFAEFEELEFWLRYVQFLEPESGFGAAITIAWCEQALLANPACVAPLLYLNAFADPLQKPLGRLRLREWLGGRRTTRAQYVLAICGANENSEPR